MDSTVDETLVLKTERLTLRPWREKDIVPFAAMGQDREVMRYFPELLTERDAEDYYARMAKSFAANRFGRWAVETADAPFVGFIGLAGVNFKASFDQSLEIGWRLASDQWGKGYASEGARAVLRYAFERLALGEVVSFASVINEPSIGVMQKIGMRHAPGEDFNHPLLDWTPHLQPCALYRITRGEWAESR